MICEVCYRPYLSFELAVIEGETPAVCPECTEAAAEPVVEEELGVSGEGP